MLHETATSASVAHGNPLCLYMQLAPTWYTTEVSCSNSSHANRTTPRCPVPQRASKPCSLPIAGNRTETEVLRSTMYASSKDPSWSLCDTRRAGRQLSTCRPGSHVPGLTGCCLLRCLLRAGMLKGHLGNVYNAWGHTSVAPSGEWYAPSMSTFIAPSRCADGTGTMPSPHTSALPHTCRHHMM